ncbi:MAG: VOC family protein [Actinobacteria bacterium]|nr:VOC family protein [Actinomycetota bacterium]
MADSGRLLGFEHIGVSVADLEAMVAWYSGALDLEVEGDFEIAALGVRGSVLSRAGFKVELIEMEGSAGDPNAELGPGAALSRRGLGHVCLRVAGIEAFYEVLLARGAVAMIAPRPSPLPGWKYAYVGDPEGNRIELMEAS